MTGIVLDERERRVHPLGDQRDLQHVGVHGGDGKQPDEAMLDGLAAGVLADHDDVGVGAVAQVARHGRLRQHQQVIGFGELGKRILAQSQNAQATGAVHGGTPAEHRAPLVTEQDEVPVSEPAQQIGDIVAIGAREPAVLVGVQRTGQAQQRRAHRRRVHRHLAGVSQHVRQQSCRLGQGPAID